MDPLAELLGESPAIVALRKQISGLLERNVERLPPIPIRARRERGRVCSLA